MNEAALVGAGLVLGFSLAVPPGPMNALIAARAAASVRSGMATGFGAMVADLALGVAIFFLHTVVDLGSFLRWVEGVGAVVMAYFAYRIVRPPAVRELGPDRPGSRDFVEAFGVGLTNPYQVAWWLTAGVAFAYLGGVALFVGLFGAITVWVVSFPIGVHAATRRSAAASRWLPLASAAAMGGFAAYFALLAAGVLP